MINVAGLNILDFTQRWTPGFKQSVWNSRVKTNEQIAKVIKNSEAKTFITVSGVAYYPTDGREYNEEDICEKYDFLSGIRKIWAHIINQFLRWLITFYFLELTHAWEAAAELPKNSAIRQVTIRSGVVLGRTGGMIKQTFLPFYFGVGGPLGSGTQPMPWIHIKDLVNLFISALKNENMKGVYNGVAPEVTENCIIKQKKVVKEIYRIINSFNFRS